MIENESAAERAAGNLHFQAGRYAQAITEYDRVLRQYPLSSTVYCNRALCLMRLGRLAEAQLDGLRTLVLRPDWEKGQYRTALALQQRHLIDRSRMSVLLALHDCGTTADLHRLLAEVGPAGEGSSAEEEAAWAGEGSPDEEEPEAAPWQQQPGSGGSMAAMEVLGRLGAIEQLLRGQALAQEALHSSVDRLRTQLRVQQPVSAAAAATVRAEVPAVALATASLADAQSVVQAQRQGVQAALLRSEGLLASAHGVRQATAAAPRQVRARPSRRPVRTHPRVRQRGDRSPMEAHSGAAAAATGHAHRSSAVATGASGEGDGAASAMAGIEADGADDFMPSLHEDSADSRDSNGTMPSLRQDSADSRDSNGTMPPLVDDSVSSGGNDELPPLEESESESSLPPLLDSAEEGSSAEEPDLPGLVLSSDEGSPPALTDSSGSSIESGAEDEPRRRPVVTRPYTAPAPRSAIAGELLALNVDAPAADQGLAAMALNRALSRFSDVFRTHGELRSAFALKCGEVADDVAGSRAGARVAWVDDDAPVPASARYGGDPDASRHPRDTAATPVAAALRNNFALTGMCLMTGAA